MLSGTPHLTTAFEWVKLLEIFWLGFEIGRFKLLIMVFLRLPHPIPCVGLKRAAEKEWSGGICLFSPPYPMKFIKDSGKMGRIRLLSSKTRHGLWNITVFEVFWKEHQRQWWTFHFHCQLSFHVQLDKSEPVVGMMINKSKTHLGQLCSLSTCL